MEKWKAFGRKLLWPPGWLIFLLSVISAVLLILVFVKGWEESPAAYATYVLSFYALTIVCVYMVDVLPRKYKQIRQKVYDTKFGNRYMTDMAFKTQVSLNASLTANLLYVGVNVLSCFLYRSMWFVMLGVYYGTLAVMRFLLLRYSQRQKLGTNRLGELKRARLCAYILLTLNFFLSGAVLMILYQNRGFEYHGILIYVMAMYTFYMTTHAIIDLVKYRKYKSPVMTISKNIALSAALVSMLALETAMFSRFGGEMKPEDQRLMVILTGAGVSIIVVTMSFYMIRRCAKEIEEIKNGR